MNKKIRAGLAGTLVAGLLTISAPAHAGHSVWIDKIKPSSIACAIWSGWC